MSDTSKWYWVLNDISDRNAGLQVRTKPIIDELQKTFFTVLTISTENIIKMMMDRKVPQDAIGFIFAKPGDAQSSLVITELKEKGYLIVIDLFDNYFTFSKWSSNTGIPYLWRQSLHLADAVIVSSPIIASWVRYLKPNANLIHVCDSLPWSNYREYNSLVSANLKKWQYTSQKRKLLWFGIGSNPWYQAGQGDLAKLLPFIRQLYLTRPFGMELELVICSNIVSNTLSLVMQYQKLGIQTRFVPWTKESCTAELKIAHCVLLPTGVGDFSRSKTHNRLSDAIKNDCIVFTTPTGPYENFIGGAVQTTLRGTHELLFHSDVTIVNSALQETILNLEKYHPFTEQVITLAMQLGSLKSNPKYFAVPRIKFIVMGFQTSGTIAKLARKISYLIVGYNSNQSILTYDIYLKAVIPDSQLVLLNCSSLGEKALGSLGLELTPCDEAGLFSIALPTECINDCNKLFLYSQLDSSHKSICEQTSSLSISILISLLKNEKSEIFLADNSGMCWSNYIKTYANYLTKPMQKLESMWKKRYEI